MHFRVSWSPPRRSDEWRTLQYPVGCGTVLTGLVSQFGRALQMAGASFARFVRYRFHRWLPWLAAMAVGDTGGEDEAAMVAALLRGDERAFDWLFNQHHTTLVGLALPNWRVPAIAEEIAQESWLHVLRGLPRFQFRSSLRTWISTIVMNRARTRARREHRSLPFADAWTAALSGGEPAVDQDRFVPSDSPENADRWVSAPRPFLPEERVLADETRAIVQRAIATLPVAQREVITLRDIEGRTATDVCNTLGLTETNQRVLLHRARSRVRAAL